MRKFLILISLLATVPAWSQPLTERYAAQLSDPLTYAAYRTRGKIKVDGKLSEKDWSRAASSETFVDISGPGFPKPSKETTVKMLWDEDYLYIGATLQEDNIVGNLKQRDTIIWKQNDFEIFIDPDGDGVNYFEIETNVRGTLLDLIMDKPYRSGGNFFSPWDGKGVQVAVYCKGTIGKSSDKDQYWTVEAAIPRKSLMWGFTDPDTETCWRINFSRVEWLQADKEENWVWSPTGKVDMHMPERWGYLIFVNAPVGSKVAPAPVNIDKDAYKLLWAMFYAQLDAKTRTGRYLASEAEFGLTLDEREKAVTIEVESISDAFSIRLVPRGARVQYCVDQDGRFTVRNAPTARMM